MSGSMACNYIPSVWHRPMQIKFKKIVEKVVSSHECVLSKDTCRKIYTIHENG